MIKWSEYVDVWPKVKRSARTSISRDGGGAYPTDSWKKTILLSEHSPIRRIKFSWQWANLKSQCHLVNEPRVVIRRKQHGIRNTSEETGTANKALARNKRL